MPKRKLEEFYQMMEFEKGIESDLEKEGYACEPKFDGTPCVIERTPKGFKIYGKRGLDYSLILPDVVNSVSKFRAFYRIIGELVYFTPESKMVFSGSQKRCQISNLDKVEKYAKAYPLILFVFEITMLNGENLEDVLFYRRRKILENFIGLQKSLYDLPNIRITPIEYKERRKMFEWCIKKGWEGILLKALNGTYHSGKRTYDIIKLKRRDHTIHTLPNNAIL